MFHRRGLDVPESELQGVFNNLLSATSGNDDARHTAVRWFNRLYYDVRRWNEGFIRFLRSYPGFRDNATAGDYEQFRVTLREYLESLSDRYNEVKNDLCSSLKILSVRFTKDFSWLYKEDQAAFWEVRRLIDDSYAAEGGIIEIANGVCQFIWQIECSENPSNHREIRERIERYIDTSKREVDRLHQMASQVGIHLLTVREYEAALARDGSRNPELLVIGEVTMGDSYSAGQAGAMGPNAHAENMTFNQIWNQSSGKINLPDLAKELGILRAEMLKEAKEPQDYSDIGNLSTAETAAQQGDGPKALQHLAKAGKWALDVATKIGVAVAAAAIKESMGG